MTDPRSTDDSAANRTVGTSTPEFHVPQVARRRDGRWGVFCTACSREASDYINPCQAWTQVEWPPPILEASGD